MNLQDTVQTEINALVESGAVTKMVKDHLTKTVDDIIKDSLRSYGDFGKKVKEAVAQCLNVDMSNVGLLDLSATINGVIKSELEAAMLADLVGPIKASIAEITQTLDKREYKLTEIVELFKADVDSWDRENSNYITLIVSKESPFTHIYFDQKGGKEKYQCGFQIDLHNGQVYNFKAGGLKNEKDGSIFFKPVLGSIEKLLFRLYAAKATVIVDEEDVNTYYDEDDEY